jgi:hypothetical protein
MALVFGFSLFSFNFPKKPIYIKKLPIGLHRLIGRNLKKSCVMKFKKKEQIYYFKDGNASFLRIFNCLGL